MQPAVPDEPSVGWSADDAANPEVGAFRPGSAASRWALARYLVGRVIGESIGWSLLVLGIGLLVLAGLAQWALHFTVLAVLLLLVALVVLLVRLVLAAVLRRLTAVDRYGPMEDELRRVVAEARRDVRRELRRIGLPSHIVTLPLLALRLAGRRRVQTVERLRRFDVDRAVPPALVDQFAVLLRQLSG